MTVLVKENDNFRILYNKEMLKYKYNLNEDIHWLKIIIRSLLNINNLLFHHYDNAIDLLQMFSNDKYKST